MCISCAPGNGGSVSRRGLLGGTGALAAAIGLSACAPRRPDPPPQAQAGYAPPASIGDERFKVILLGTQAGPPIEPDRMGISTAIVIEGQVYVVDCGRGSATQYVRSGLQQQRLNSMFITHLHADHITDYYNFFLSGGSIPNSAGDSLGESVNVFGPGSAEGLQPAFNDQDVPTIGVDPTPGIVEMTDHLTEAYAYSHNVFIRDTGVRDVRSLMNVREVEVPDVGSSFEDTAPPMDPFIVMEDDRVRVSAILVPHGPVYPAFAYRFDSEYGSVTISGDTTYTPNIPALAEDTDILIHEAINVRGGEITENQMFHMLESHVEVQELGPIAEEAGAKKLVLSHIGDPTASGRIDAEQWKAWAQEGYSGPVHVGSDLDHLVVD